MFNLNPLVYLLLGISLAGCATSKSVRNAEDIVDDGKRNSIMLSYEIRLDSHDRYPGFNSTELAFRCGPNKSINPYPVCFSINVIFNGKRQENDYVYNSFEASGAKIYQIKYGEYSLAKASHSILVGQRRDRICHPSKKRRRYKCHDEFVDVRSDFIATLPQPAEFKIGEGEGCYLGHLKLHMRGNKVLSYELDTAYNAEKFSELPDKTRAAAQARVKAPCIS